MPYLQPTNADLNAGTWKTVLIKRPDTFSLAAPLAITHINYVAELNGKLVGGAGIYPTEGLPEKTCELVKLYLNKDARGIGLGKQLLLKSMQWAKENGYEQVYLESMPELSKAVSIYENVGFKKIHHALGNSGHDGCDIWMIKNL